MSGAGVTRALARVEVRVLLLLTFTAGVFDAISFVGLDQVFVALITGNILLIGFGLSEPGLTIGGPARRDRRLLLRCRGHRADRPERAQPRAAAAAHGRGGGPAARPGRSPRDRLRRPGAAPPADPRRARRRDGGPQRDDPRGRAARATDDAADAGALRRGDRARPQPRARRSRAGSASAASSCSLPAPRSAGCWPIRRRSSGRC